MKRKISVFMFLLGIIFTALANKQYVVINAEGSQNWWNIYLSGSIPSGMSSEYSGASLGRIINELGANGFVVEQITSTVNAYHSQNGILETIILSKSSSNQSNAIEQINDDDTEAVEVARYNMQGLPVNENEKGVQIVVYSNFTAKVVIVQ